MCNPVPLTFSYNANNHMKKVRVVPELNVWEGRVAASFFFTLPWVVGFLINKILWEVEDIKIKIACLVGKLKATINLCGSSSVLRQLLPLIRRREC